MVHGHVQLTGAVPSPRPLEVPPQMSTSHRRGVTPTTGPAPGHGRIRWCAMVQGFEEDSVPSASRSPSRTPIPNSDWWTWRLRRSWIAARVELRRAHRRDAAPGRATIPKSSARIDFAAPTRRSRAGVFGLTVRTIGARTSTCAHDTSPDRNASPVASCSRARRHLPTSIDAPDRRHRRPVREPRPRATPRRAPIRPRVPLADRADDLGLERSATSSSSTCCSTGPHPPGARSSASRS